MSCMMIDDCPSGGDQTAREPVRHNVVRLPERNVSQPRCFRTVTSYMQELAIFVSPLCSHRYFPTRVSLCVNLKRKVRELLCALPFFGSVHTKLIISDFLRGRVGPLCVALLSSCPYCLSPPIFKSSLDGGVRGQRLATYFPIRGTDARMGIS